MDRKSSMGNYHFLGYAVRRSLWRLSSEFIALSICITQLLGTTSFDTTWKHYSLLRCCVS